MDHENILHRYILLTWNRHKSEYVPDNDINCLQEIMIATMAITDCNEMAFAGIHDLRTLTLFHTELIYMPPLNPIKSTLKILNLNSNRISFVPSGYFQGFKQLQKLFFTENTFRVVPDISALHNTIVVLILSMNSIHSINGWLNEAIYLQLSELYLDHNVIREFDPNMLSYWPNLNLLNLDGNRIVQLPTGYKEDHYKNCSEDNPNVCTLHFERNPIHCDRSIEGIITRWRKEYDSSRITCNVEIYGLSRTICSCPARLRGRDLATLGK